MAKTKNFTTELGAIRALDRNTLFEDPEFDDYRSNKRVVKKAIEVDSRAFGWSSPEMRDDKELAMLAMKKDGRQIQYCSDRLKNDKEIVLEACYGENSDGWMAMDYASNEIVDQFLSKERPEMALRSAIAHEKLQASLAQKRPAPARTQTLKI